MAEDKKEGHGGNSGDGILWIIFIAVFAIMKFITRKQTVSNRHPSL